MTGLVTNVINSAPSTSLPPRHWKVTGLTHTEATCHWVQDMATERSEQSLPAGQKPTVPVLKGPEKRHHRVSEAREPRAPERVRGPTARGGKHPRKGCPGAQRHATTCPHAGRPPRTQRGAHRPGDPERSAPARVLSRGFSQTKPSVHLPPRFHHQLPKTSKTRSHFHAKLFCSCNVLPKH